MGQTVDLGKLIKHTGLEDSVVMEALKVPDRVSWLYSMSKRENLKESRSLYDTARTGKIDHELVTELADIHEARAQKMLDKSQDTGTIDIILTYAIKDNPAYTAGAEILSDRFRHHTSLSWLHSKLRGDSKNDELVRKVRKKLSDACKRAVAKNKLTLAELAKLRRSADNLTELNEGCRLINRRFKESLDHFLANTKSVRELINIRGYFSDKRELSMVDNKITELVIFECKNGKEFKCSSSLLKKCWNMILGDPARLACMSLLADRTKSFRELVCVFGGYTDSDFAKELRAKILNKLIDLTDKRSELMFIYNMKFISELPKSAHKKKIVQKLVRISLEKQQQ